MLALASGFLGVVWGVRNYTVDAVAIILVGFFIGCVLPPLLLPLPSVLTKKGEERPQASDAQSPVDRLGPLSPFPQIVRHVPHHRPRTDWVSSGPALVWYGGGQRGVG